MAMIYKIDDCPVLTPVPWPVLRLVLLPLWKCNPWCPTLLRAPSAFRPLCLLCPPRRIFSITFQNVFFFMTAFNNCKYPNQNWHGHEISHFWRHDDSVLHSDNGTGILFQTSWNKVNGMDLHNEYLHSDDKNIHICKLHLFN